MPYLHSPHCPQAEPVQMDSSFASMMDEDDDEFDEVLEVDANQEVDETLKV